MFRKLNLVPWTFAMLTMVLVCGLANAQNSLKDTPTGQEQGNKIVTTGSAQSDNSKGWDGNIRGRVLVTPIVINFDNPADYDNFAAGRLRLNLILTNTISGQTFRLDPTRSGDFSTAPDKRRLTINIVIDNMSAPLGEAACGQIMPSAESSGDSTVNITLSYGACGVEQKRGINVKSNKGIVVGNGGSGYRTQKTDGNLNIMLGDSAVMTREAVAGLPRGPGMITISLSKGAGSPKAAGF